MILERDAADAAASGPWAALSTTQLLDGAVTEVLRYHHPNQQTTTPRLALVDVKDAAAARSSQLDRSAWRSVPPRPGTTGPRWTDPERFDVARPELVSLSFGQGHTLLSSVRRSPTAQATATLAAASVRDARGWRSPTGAPASGTTRNGWITTDRVEVTLR